MQELADALQRRPLRITVERIVNVVAGSVRDEPTALLVIEGELVAVGPDQQVGHPDAARSINMPGSTALPGLFDNHVHVTFPRGLDQVAAMAAETDDQLVTRGTIAAERMVRSGITTAVDQGARGSVGFAVRANLRNRVAAGPRLLVSGPPITATRGHCWFLGGEADGVKAVRARVRRLVAHGGANVIKIMATGGGLTPETDIRKAAYSTSVLAAAVDEAHGLGTVITAHAHGTVGIRRAVEAHVDAIQHCTMLGPHFEWAFDESAARLMTKRGIRAVPTIAAGLRFDIETGRVATQSPEGGHDGMTRSDGYANARRLHEMGVEILPGTDAGVYFTDFAEELFLELETYVSEVGLSPIEVIRKATIDSARFLRLDNITGSLEPGKAADVLVVAGRPDEDITSLRHPLLVLARGEVIQPTALAESPLA